MKVFSLKYIPCRQTLAVKNKHAHFAEEINIYVGVWH